MLAPLLLAAAAFAAPPAPPVVVSLEAELSSSALARRLLAADAPVPRVEARASGLPRAVDVRGGAKPEIVVDLTRAPELPPAELRAEYARALAAASVASPLPLVEAEQAVRQWTAQVLVELAVEDAALAKALAAPPAHAPEVAKAARFLAAFRKDPETAWGEVEAEPPARGAARLLELEDLLAARGGAVRSLKELPAGPYVRLDGRRYPSRLVREAWPLRAPGAVAALRENLGAYDSAGVTSLRDALKALRDAPRGRP